MSVIAMSVTAVNAHPNADALRVYTFEAPQRPVLQVVANMENVYEVGDVVAVAQIGAKLKDGMRIRRAKLRGVESLGMAMGSVDCPVGTDLSAEHCMPEAPEDTSESKPTPAVSVVKWASIELLHNVLRNLEGRRDFLGDQFVFPKVDYRAKVKLDGTNGGIHILASGEVVAQSRTRLLSEGDDNVGFAAWVKQHEAYFQGLSGEHEHLILFGEWCGQGIQKRTAISKIDRKIFTVFAIQYGDHHEAEVQMEICPERIQAMLPPHNDIFVLPWMGEAIFFDYSDRSQLEASAAKINEMVLQTEETDPWVSSLFGIDGLGEGVVMYPLIEGYDEGPVLRERCSQLMYKAKGEKHQVVKQKKAAQLDPEVVKSVSAFAEMFVTEQRLEQAVQEAAGGVYEFAKMGDLLKWMGQDVKKEGVAELEAAGLEWKQVSKAVMGRAKTWYKGKIEAL